MKPLPWPWRWDARPHGWQGNRFGPLDVAPPVRPEALTDEQRAAARLISQAHRAEQKRQLIKAVGVK